MIKNSKKNIKLRIKNFKDKSKPTKTISVKNLVNNDDFKVDTVEAAELYMEKLDTMLINARKGTFKLKGGEIQAGMEYEDFKQVKFSKAPKNIKSPAFKKWFKGSKVVDANGDPLVVYHGTKFPENPNFQNIVGKEQNFHVFDVGERFGDLGSHFTVSQQVASEHFTGSDGGRIYPVYLSIKNPLRVQDSGGFDIISIRDDLIKSGVATETEVKALWNKYAKAGYGGANVENKIIKDFLESKGYDGIVYKNRGELPGTKKHAHDYIGNVNRNTSDQELIDKGAPLTENIHCFLQHPNQIRI